MTGLFDRSLLLFLLQYSSEEIPFPPTFINQYQILPPLDIFSSPTFLRSHRFSYEKTGEEDVSSHMQKREHLRTTKGEIQLPFCVEIC